jgi:hypothetical protein
MDQTYKGWTIEYLEYSGTWSPRTPSGNGTAVRFGYLNGVHGIDRAKAWIDAEIIKAWTTVEA